jgi:23S rRNA-/tRNA-specific pseudouridylate synthase
VTGGKAAVTEFRLLSSSGGTSLVEARPLTGRTHQIRVHLADSGLPIIGDSTYGGQSTGRMMLHCAEMGLKNEQGKDIRVIAPLDEAFYKEHGCLTINSDR